MAGLRSMIEDNTGAVDEIRVAFLVFVIVWLVGAFYTLFWKPEYWLETLGVGALNMGIAAVNSRFQERKENVIQAAKPTDTTQVKVEA